MEYLEDTFRSRSCFFSPLSLNWTVWLTSRSWRLFITDLLFSYRQDPGSLQKSGQDHLSRTPLSSPPGRKRDMSEHRTRQSSGLECSTSVPPGLLCSKGAPCGWTRSHVLKKKIEYRRDQGLVGNRQPMLSARKCFRYSAFSLSLLLPRNSVDTGVLSPVPRWSSQSVFGMH